MLTTLVDSCGEKETGVMIAHIDNNAKKVFRICHRKPRYINVELEEGKPSRRFSDYQPFSGSCQPQCLCWRAFRRLSATVSATLVQPARHSPQADLPEFVIVRKSAIGLDVQEAALKYGGGDLTKTINQRSIFFKRQFGQLL